MSDDMRWRYAKSDGSPVWLPFNAGFPCIYCADPVGALSYGGPAVCPRCDCGYDKEGRQWSVSQAHVHYNNARARLDALPNDPVWQEFEAAVSTPPGEAQ
jgi:hypothetical protein